MTALYDRIGANYVAVRRPDPRIADAIRATGHPSVLVIDSPTELIGLVGRYGHADDMIVFLGAGTSTEWAHALPGWLAEQPRLAGE